MKAYSIFRALGTATLPKRAHVDGSVLEIGLTGAALKRA